MNQKPSRRVIARVITSKLLAEPAQRAHWLKVLAAYLETSGRVEEVDFIANDIAHELFVQRGELLVHVKSARPLEDKVRAELKKLLKELTDAQQIELSEDVDKTLLGGVVARTPSAQLDLSVRSKLKKLATIK